MTAGFYYDHTTYPVYGSQSSSPLDRAEWELVQAGFDKLPYPTGFPNALVKVKADETGLDVSVATLTSAGVMAGLTGLTSTGTINFTGGTVTVATQAAGDSSTKVASTAFVAAQAFSTALPSLAGNDGKVPFLQAGVVGWSLIGTAGQSLRVNAGGTSLEGYTPAAPVGSTVYLAQTAGAF